MQHQETGLPLPKHEWTMVNSFFSVMGGFVMDTNDEGTRRYITNSPKLALTAKGVWQLAVLGCELPDIPLQSIKDRSKANTFAKGIACIQASYLILQLIARLANRLPITLLEINTLGHALCALILFLFWLRKPYDVQSPIPVAGTWTRPLTALWSLSSCCDINGCRHHNEYEGLFPPAHDRQNFECFIGIASNRTRLPIGFGDIGSSVTGPHDIRKPPEQSLAMVMFADCEGTRLQEILNE